jgi:hypothetical protein
MAKSILEYRPNNRKHLVKWLKVALDLEVPRSALIEGHQSPLDYLCHTFFELPGTPADCVVWASRGGGKTFYAAVATVLDLLFKPGIDVKILGGSLDQARRMHDHLRTLLDRPALRGVVDGRITSRRAALRNGSRVEVLAQSHTSVRGTRPQKLRCDEVELFDPEVWAAAQLVTRSRECVSPGGVRVMARASVEALSTLHKPSGLMSELVREGSPRLVLRWGVIDALARCEESRACAACVLFPECGGRAKDSRRVAGHVTIDDAITLKKRASAASWRAEMLCEMPSERRAAAVFAEFDPLTHVRETPDAIEGLDTPAMDAAAPPTPWVCGMDFGMRGETAVLWAALRAGDVLHVMDERIASDVVLREHIEAIRRGLPRWSGLAGAAAHETMTPWPTPRWVGVDPAGAQRSLHTGTGAVQTMREAGLVVRHRRLALEAGLRIVRARLAPASGPPRLIVHPRCERLIEALRCYRWPEAPATVRSGETTPIKDGHDHAVDALRYLIVNLDAPHRAEVREY